MPVRVWAGRNLFRGRGQGRGLRPLPWFDRHGAGWLHPAGGRRSGIVVTVSLGEVSGGLAGGVIG
jgi:hypothetical protein